MKRFLSIVALALEAALLAGVFAIDRFSHAKLGFVRWLNYHNQQWAEAFPLPAAGIAAVAALAVLIAVAIVVFARSRRRRATGVVALAASCGLAGAFAWFAFSFDTASVRAYYLMALCLLVAALLQAVVAIAACHSRKMGAHGR